MFPPTDGDDDDDDDSKSGGDSTDYDESHWSGDMMTMMVIVITMKTIDYK